MNLSENAFEEHIVQALTSPEIGYRFRTSKEHYNKKLALDPGMLLEFIQTSQPEAWQKLVKLKTTPELAGKSLMEVVQNHLGKFGLLQVLRKGVKDSGIKFDLAYFLPASNLNPDHLKKVEQNLFSVVRQLVYSEKHNGELDLVVFLNGLPLCTAELKNKPTGQTVWEARQQYQTDRDPRELLFKRALVHFAVDNDEVYMTTLLDGAATRFLPFNKGHQDGAGNPPNPTGYATEYLWREVWQPRAWLDLLSNFIFQHKKTLKVTFPRFHQWKAVRGLIDHARQHGPGKNYLIQHSAGSGKSNSIAWLAHMLSELHDASNKKVFDGVLVITDRKVLDQALQETVEGFQQVSGVVQNIDKNSKQLADALGSGGKIIVTTLQKFPFAMEHMQSLEGKTFAVIVDEAHSSQTGESAKALKQLLGEALEVTEDEVQFEDVLDAVAEKLVREQKSRQQKSNLSFFAFTATPKSKTLEIFGEKQPDGSFQPFSLYSMKQAIEEGFIHDVLQNFVSYQTYFNLQKKIEDDPELAEKRTVKVLKAYAADHDINIQKKTEIMLEHFVNVTSKKIGGEAKAMVVTSFRLHAVRYKLAFDRYIKEHKLPFKVLVAFSGTVTHDGVDFTETSMNGFSESQTAREFDRPEHRILIVANKFQTGFSQSRLHTMYVDKQLSDVATVQTLSRLNRIHPGKEETMVLDFVNDPEHVQKDFERYYKVTRLSAATDPNLLYILQSELESTLLYQESQVLEFGKHFYSEVSKPHLVHATLDPIVATFNSWELPDKVAFKKKARDFVRLYAFLSQVISFTDASLELLYAFLRVLLTKLPLLKGPEAEVDAQSIVDMESFRIQKIAEKNLALKEGDDLNPQTLGEHMGISEDEKQALSRILEAINKRFGTDFSPEDRVTLMGVVDKLVADQGLIDSVQANSAENVQIMHNQLLDKKFVEILDQSFDLYQRYSGDPDFKGFVQNMVFEVVYKKIKESIDRQAS